jgi:Xaa-Pro aminopeptidase
MADKRMQDALGDLPRLQRNIVASQFDVVVAASPENVLYTSDAFVSTQVDIRDRLALIAWDGTREPIFVLCRVEVGYVQQESWIQDIRDYKEFVTSPVELLADALIELGAEQGLIGLEMEYLAAGYVDQLRQRLPNATFQACETVFDQTRMYKTPREREVMAEAFRGTERALKEAFEATRAGHTERDMCYRLADGILRSGAESVAFTHINGGPNTGFPHMDPSDYRVKPGDMLKADAGGRYQRYYSNVGRTAKLGPLTDEDRSWWGRLRDIHREIIDMARPGNTGRQLFERATELHAAADIPFPYAHNGHSLGLLVHEHPLISPHEEIAYEAGMMTTVETRVRWVGDRGYHMEDLVEITDGAPVVRSNYFDNEEILVVEV